MPVDIEVMRKKLADHPKGYWPGITDDLAGVIDTLVWERKELWEPLRDASRTLMNRLGTKNSPNGEWISEAMRDVQAALDGIGCSL